MAPALPSTAQVALALLVIKSRPLDVSIEEYIHDLRSVIRYRGQEGSVNSGDYIDAATFWKLTYENSKSEKESLKNKIFELEQEILILKRRNSSSPISPTEKRTWEPRPINRANTQSKRKRTSDVQSDIPTDEEQDGDNHVVSRNCTTLLRGLHLLRRNIRDSKLRLQTEDIQSIWADANTSLWQACERLETNPTLPRFEPSSKEVCKIILQIWIATLRSTCQEENLRHDARLQTNTLVDILAILRTILSRLHQSCLNEAREAVKLNLNDNGNGCDERVVQGKDVGEQKQEEEKRYALASTAAQFFTSLNLSVNMHCKLLEGLVCILLDHIGSALSVAIFAETSNDQDEQIGILAPQGLNDVQHVGHEVTVATTHIEAPYLVRILRSVLGVIKSPIASEMTGSAVNREPSSFQRSQLTNDIHERLQATLLRGIYGVEDDDYANTLARVECTVDEEVESDFRNLRKEDRSEWFLGQVWELLGWDILAIK